jgi:hypothetical protein
VRRLATAVLVASALAGTIDARASEPATGLQPWVGAALTTLAREAGAGLGDLTQLSVAVSGKEATLRVAYASGESGSISFSAVTEPPGTSLAAGCFGIEPTPAGGAVERLAQRMASGIGRVCDRSPWSAEPVPEPPAPPGPGRRHAPAAGIPSWLGTAVVFARIHPTRIAIGLAWLALFASLAVAASRSPFRTRAAAVALPVVGGLAVGIRLALATLGPGDIQISVLGQPYGEGPPVLLSAIGFLTGGNFEGAIVSAIALGALTPVLCAFLASSLGLDDVGAVASGAVLAVLPLAVRFSGAAQREPFELFAAVAAMWGMAGHVRHGGVFWLAPTLLGTFLCSESRPEGFGFLALIAAPMLVVCHRRKAPLARPIVALCSLALAGAGHNPLWSRGALGDHLDSFARRGVDLFLPTLDSLVWLSPRFSPAFVTILFVAGCVVSLRARDGVALWAVPSMLAASLVALWFNEPLEHSFTSARYQGLVMIPLAVTSGLGFSALLGPGAWKARRVATALAALALVTVAAATSVPAYRFVCDARTPELEFAFLRQEVSALPEDAEIYAVLPGTAPWDPVRFPGVMDLFQNGLRSMQDLSILIDRPAQSWRRWPNDLAPSPRPKFFYYQAACSASPPRARDPIPDSIDAAAEGIDPLSIEVRKVWDLCEGARRTYGQARMAGTVVPASPLAGELYRSGTVEMALYAIDDPGLMARPEAR